MRRALRGMDCSARSALSMTATIARDMSVEGEGPVPAEQRSDALQAREPDGRYTLVSKGGPALLGWPVVLVLSSSFASETVFGAESSQSVPL